MSHLRLEICSAAAYSKTQRNLVREALLLSLLLCGALRSAQGLAADLPPDNLSLDLAPPQNFSAPHFSAKPLTNVEIFSETEFRPRRHAEADADSVRHAAAIIDAPMARDNSIWQHMSEYKSQDRLRLLTLWQTRGSSLSVQTGRHGAPSLQWSTPWVRRESASRGLFDHLIVLSPRVFEGGSRSVLPRAASGALGSAKNLEPAASLPAK